MTNFLISPHLVTAGLLGPHGKVFFGRSYDQDMKENQIWVVLVHQVHGMSWGWTGQSEGLHLLEMPGTAMACVTIAGKQVFNLDSSVCLGQHSVRLECYWLAFKYHT